ncbi:MAG: VTT domain-containing protein [Clostridia bacterium]|nr:VTT domain-containing protein [Clostridia bacterium]
MSRRTEKIIILVSALAAVLLFAFFLKDILVPFIKLEIKNDVDGARELLRSKGVLGFFAVALVEALQMVVVFIPAEFIQISSGLSYPFYIALILCDIGVCLGASIIFVLVRTFRFRNEAYERSKKTINIIAEAEKGKETHKSTVLFMLLLFIMPLIPFGAICYYGSSTRIKYHKYIATVAGGVIPSIVTSNLMGAAAKAFIRDAMPLWLLILIIAVLAGLLFAALAFFINKFFLKQHDGTPDSPVYALLFRLADIIWKRSSKLHVDNAKLLEISAPYILLVNHQSFRDFYYSKQFDTRGNPSYVANEYYLYSNAFLRRLAKKMGLIPKKLFTVDIVTVAGVFRMLRKGYPVIIFPEGRLSVDGTTNRIVEPGAAFYKKLGVPVVLASIRGAYFAKPKWRKKYYRSDVYLTVEQVIGKEELTAYPDEELNRLISEKLYFDASVDNDRAYRQKRKAVGLDNILYRCIDCGALYTTKGAGNDLRCSACGAVHHLNDRYRFDGTPGTIPEYYRAICELERADLDGLCLETAVNVKIFDKNVKLRRREKGVCTLTPDGFTYCPDLNRGTDPVSKNGDAQGSGFFKPIAQLPALPFSCAEEFETYNDDELYYFYPRKNRKQAVRWALLADLLRERQESNGQEQQ